MGIEWALVLAGAAFILFGALVVYVSLHPLVERLDEPAELAFGLTFIVLGVVLIAIGIGNPVTHLPGG